MWVNLAIIAVCIIVCRFCLKWRDDMVRMECSEYYSSIIKNRNHVIYNLRNELRAIRNSDNVVVADYKVIEK